VVISRRAFLATAAALLPVPARAADFPIGIQLYSVDADLGRDFAGTLRQLAAMGYSDVELADPMGKTARELRDAFKIANLACRSGHFGVDQLEKDLPRTIAFAQELGLSYIVCPMPRLADMQKPRREEWLWHADFFNRVGAEIKNAGLQFGYHNHNLEFTRYTAGGRTRSAYDELIARTDPTLVKLQLDCGWAAAAGLDPAIVLARYPGRFRLLHVKDVKADQEPNTQLKIETTAIGAGVLDWRAIIAAAKAAGVVGYYVELEPPSTPKPLDAARESAAYLAAL
jgi:sugar phosphate isomerase/epimerase